MDCRKHFSNTLSALRRGQGLSLEALGKVLGITGQAVSLLEKGKRSPSFEVFIALADYFAVSLDYLVGRSDDP